jgi:hypothetical protein
MKALLEEPLRIENELDLSEFISEAQTIKKRKVMYQDITVSNVALVYFKIGPFQWTRIISFSGATE